MSDLKTPLTGAQKVAVVLMNMDQQRAAQVMKQFSEEEADEITAEILRLRRVDPAIAEKALERVPRADRPRRDVDPRRPRHRGRPAGGVLRRREGRRRDEPGASTMAGKQFEFLDVVEPGQIHMLLAGELPQTIALVLAHLRAEHASRVLAGLDEDIRTEVAHAIATMGARARMPCASSPTP